MRDVTLNITVRTDVEKTPGEAELRRIILGKATDLYCITEVREATDATATCPASPKS